MVIHDIQVRLIYIKVKFSQNLDYLLTVLPQKYCTLQLCLNSNRQEKNKQIQEYKQTRKVKDKNALGSSSILNSFRLIHFTDQKKPCGVVCCIFPCKRR